jgi:2-dehydro-3-deoxyphosphogluconate aldolase/(4S)-4-hydroxy-2-oxoglutarate aldolase
MPHRDFIEGTRNEVLEEGVILCVRMGAGDPVLDACRAALDGGLRVLEITLTTPGALEIISELSSDDRAVVGGGTVLTPDDARAVAIAGGRFALSPVFQPQVVDEAHLHGLLAVPGTATPSEMLKAHRHGAMMIKVFPAGQLGGPAYLKSVRGPFPDIPMVPTSGPDSENISEYFDAGAVAVGVGAEVFPPGFTLDGVNKAARRVKEAVDRARGKR